MAARNHYDRVGHFMQGFIAAIVLREFLLRETPLQRGFWLILLLLLSVLGWAALYEIAEWWVGDYFGASADSFLAFQGDEWDTQKDMALALLGAALALLLLSGLHNRALANLELPT